MSQQKGRKLLWDLARSWRTSGNPRETDAQETSTPGRSKTDGTAHTSQAQLAQPNDDDLECDLSMPFWIPAGDKAEIGEIQDSMQVANYYVRRLRGTISIRKIPIEEIISTVHLDHGTLNRLLDKVYCCGQTVPIILSGDEPISGNFLLQSLKHLAECLVEEARREGREPPTWAANPTVEIIDFKDLSPSAAYDAQMALCAFYGEARIGRDATYREVGALYIKAYRHLGPQAVPQMRPMPPRTPGAARAPAATISTPEPPAEPGIAAFFKDELVSAGALAAVIATLLIRGGSDVALTDPLFKRYWTIMEIQEGRIADHRGPIRRTYDALWLHLRFEATNGIIQPRQSRLSRTGHGGSRSDV